MRFAIAHLVAQALKLSDENLALISSPQRWLPGQREDVKAALTGLTKDVIDSVNFYIGQCENADASFDPQSGFQEQGRDRAS
jgi:hypothetical protein